MSILLTITVIAIILGIIYWHRNRGREKVIEENHEYYSRLWLWPKGEHTRWEAEYDIESTYSNGKIGLYAEDNYEISASPDPTEQEVIFSKKYISDLTRLFPVLRPIGLLDPRAFPTEASLRGSGPVQVG